MALSNSQFDAVMRRYEEIRSSHIDERDERVRVLNAAIPELKELDMRTADLSLMAARRIASDPSYSIEDYRREMRELSHKKASLIRAAGFPSDYTELQYDCPICKDTGFADGRRCRCFTRLASEIIRKQLGSADADEKEDFRHFSLALYSDTIQDKTSGISPRAEAEIALHASRELIAKLGNNPPSLILTGHTGVGKTHLAHAIAGEAIKNGASVLYFTAPQLFEHLSELTFSRNYSLEDRDLISGCDLLIIDDLGTELTNTYTASELFRLIEERIQKKRATVISTNLTASEIKNRYSERISSRIGSSYQLLHLSGDDLRMRKVIEGNY